MAHLNHKGPEDKGPKTGRMLGKCHKTDKEKQIISKKYNLGKGMGRKKRKVCAEGKGNRLRASELFD